MRTEELADRLYSAQRPRLLAIAKRNCVNGEEAEEALHDAFILFIDHFDPEGEAPALAWLTLTLKRRCWALSSRQQLARNRAPISSATVSIGSRSQAITDSVRLPDELAEVTEKVAEVRSQLAELKPNERRALCLLALGYSYSEICELTEWTYTKVNRCLAEGRARLRELAGDS